MQYDWFVIINPVSGGKAAPKRWHKIKPLFDAAPFNYEVIFTEYRDHAALIAKNAVQQGFRRFVILGGDGTANDVINGLCQSGISTEMFTVAMIPAGTGNDWVRT
ncbi:MAG TPA: acylglycerol kinase family protein, partial [Chitinophagales bacterium]|nr:acylglycerol kinase family protein [Chitinophagales bacterium]